MDPARARHLRRQSLIAFGIVAVYALLILLNT